MQIPRQPKSNEKIEAERAVSCGGGPASNAAVCVARLELRAGFAGYLSHDVYGQAHLAELRHDGVDVSLVSFGDRPMRVASIYVKPNGDRSVVHSATGPSPIQTELVSKVPWFAKVVLFDGYEPELVSAVLDQLDTFEPSRRPITVLDAGSVRETTRELAHRVDHLVCSEAFAREYTGQKDCEMALEQMGDLASRVVVTRGERGAIWSRRAIHAAERTARGSVEAVKVRAVDTTGAGDAFHGGYCAALALGLEWDEVLAWAGACGTLACMTMGARPSMPDRVTLEQMLASR
jgi:sulfofructose kinase